MTGDSGSDKNSSGSEDKRSDKGNDKSPEKTVNKDFAIEKNKAQPAASKPDVKTEKAVKSESQEKNKPQAKANVSKKTSPVLKILLGLALVFIVGGIGYFAWQTRQLQQELQQWQLQQQKRFEMLEAQAATQHTEVTKLAKQQSQQVGNQRALLDKLTSDQQLIQQRLNSHTQRLRSLAGTSRDDWLLAEARYLLRLASQRLLVERRSEGAQALLESADNILQAVDDTDIQIVRDAIASDIVTLKLAKTVDRQGIYAQLSALKIQIQSLSNTSMRLEAKPEQFTAKPSAESSNTSWESFTWYQSVWNSIVNAFGIMNFVRVSAIDDVPELLMTDQRQAQILNNLLLMFEQAQFALLHEEALIYKTSLQQALDWWQAHFLQYAEYEIIFSELKRLQSLSISQKLPLITQSIKVLSDYIERYHQLNNPQPAKPIKNLGGAR